MEERHENTKKAAFQNSHHHHTAYRASTGPDDRLCTGSGGSGRQNGSISYLFHRFLSARSRIDVLRKAIIMEPPPPPPSE